LNSVWGTLKDQKELLAVAHSNGISFLDYSNLIQDIKNPS